MAFKDGNDLKLRDKDGRLFSRRAALAGAAGALAFAGTCLYSFVNRALRDISARRIRAPCAPASSSVDLAAR